MSGAPQRALAFGIGTGDDVGGLRTSRRGGLEVVEGDDAVRQAILLLLATTPGERVMRPDYGCDLQRLVFAANDATSAGLAIHQVRSALERWEPRIELRSVDAGPHPGDPGRLDVVVEYVVRASGAGDRLLVTVELEGT